LCLTEEFWKILFKNPFKKALMVMGRGYLQFYFIFKTGLLKVAFNSKRGEEVQGKYFLNFLGGTQGKGKGSQGGV